MGSRVPAAHGSSAVEGNSGQACVCLEHVCLQEFGRHFELQHLPHQQIAVTAASEVFSSETRKGYC